MDSIYEILPQRIKQAVSPARWEELKPEELRFRIHAPFFMTAQGSEWYLGADRGMQKSVAGQMPAAPVIVSPEMLSEVLNASSHHSMYAYQEEIRQGFFTYPGGHRIGVCGSAVCEHGLIRGIKNICFLNVRIARECPGCADTVLPYLFENGRYLSTVIFSIPGAGKTTLLRDCIRQLSNGSGCRPGQKVCVVDERGEIAGCHKGVPGLEVGMRTDVLEGGSKGEAMRYLLRSMSPEIIAVDEMGGSGDYEALQQVIFSGCAFLVTVHAASIEELAAQEMVEGWIRRKQFRRFVQIRLGQDGKRNFHVYDERMGKLC